jgi:hypothetical protein
MFWRNRNFWFDVCVILFGTCNPTTLPKKMVEQGAFWFAKLFDVENEGSLPEVDVLPESVEKKRSRQESNLRTRLRRPMLYPLSYGNNIMSIP